MAAAQRSQGLGELAFEKLSERVRIAGELPALGATIEVQPSVDGEAWLITSVTPC